MNTSHCARTRTPPRRPNAGLASRRNSAAAVSPGTWIGREAASPARSAIGPSGPPRPDRHRRRPTRGARAQSTRRRSTWMPEASDPRRRDTGPRPRGYVDPRKRKVPGQRLPVGRAMECESQGARPAAARRSVAVRLERAANLDRMVLHRLLAGRTQLAQRRHTASAASFGRRPDLQRAHPNRRAHRCRRSACSRRSGSTASS